jgi:m7GpppX diphosphatase
VRETPARYAALVAPHIAALPAARTQWVADILSGAAEADKVLFADDALVLMPDMKWDLRTLSSLYLVALARDPALRSMRDLRAQHLPLLRAVRKHAARVASERWGVPPGALRYYVHYPPSYCACARPGSGRAR